VAASKNTGRPSAARPGKREGGSWDWVFAPRRSGEKRYWLVKSEPEVFSFDDLMKAPDRTTHWDGVRNYTARNFMRDVMRIGDPVLFYHSNATPPAIVGLCEVVREGYPDHTADQDSHDPVWFMVDLRAVRPLPRPLPLPELKGRKELAGMALLRIGRLSVSPVRPDEWKVIMAMAT
jgi:predicted RNA-binding protein with PUA-like domain